MEGSGHCQRDDSSLQAPLPWSLDGGRQHDKWARRMAGVMIRHHRHQPTSWPIKRAFTSWRLERRWISTDLIGFNNDQCQRMNFLTSMLILLLGTKVLADEGSRERKFPRTKVARNESSWGRKLHLQNESSRVRKFHESYLHSLPTN